MMYNSYSMESLWSFLVIGVMVGLFILIILSIIFMVRQVTAKK